MSSDEEPADYDNADDDPYNQVDPFPPTTSFEVDSDYRFDYQTRGWKRQKVSNLISNVYANPWMYSEWVIGESPPQDLAKDRSEGLKLQNFLEEEESYWRSLEPVDEQTDSPPPDTTIIAYDLKEHLQDQFEEEYYLRELSEDIRNPYYDSFTVFQSSMQTALSGPPDQPAPPVGPNPILSSIINVSLSSEIFAIVELPLTGYYHSLVTPFPDLHTFFTTTEDVTQVSQLSYIAWCIRQVTDSSTLGYLIPPLDTYAIYAVLALDRGGNELWNDSMIRPYFYNNPTAYIRIVHNGNRRDLHFLGEQNWDLNYIVQQLTDHIDTRSRVAIVRFK